MAINKNFVIKNGIQVNDNLLVADPDNNKIGINTALPDYELHVNGGIGATHALISGVTTSIGDLLVGADGGLCCKGKCRQLSWYWNINAIVSS